jgi:hypothetical protein
MISVMAMAAAEREMSMPIPPSDDPSSRRFTFREPLSASE